MANCKSTQRTEETPGTRARTNNIDSKPDAKRVIRWVPVLLIEGKPLDDGITTSCHARLPGAFDTLGEAMAVAEAAFRQRLDAIGVSVQRVDLSEILSTPRTCREAHADTRAALLLDCWVGERGPGVYVLLTDGEPCPMYLLNLEHISDPLFDDLTPTERSQIIDHFMQTPPAPLVERFQPQEKPSFTLLRRSAGVRLWGSETAAHEAHGKRCDARVHYHVTVDSEALMVLMRDYDAALANFQRAAGEEP